MSPHRAIQPQTPSTHAAAAADSSAPRARTKGGVAGAHHRLESKVVVGAAQRVAGGRGQAQLGGHVGGGGLEEGGIIGLLGGCGETSAKGAAGRGEGMSRAGGGGVGAWPGSLAIQVPAAVAQPQRPGPPQSPRTQNARTGTRGAAAFQRAPHAPASKAAASSPSSLSKKPSTKTLLSFCAVSRASTVATSVVAGPVFFLTHRMMSSLRGGKRGGAGAGRRQRGSGRRWARGGGVARGRAGRGRVGQGPGGRRMRHAGLRRAPALHACARSAWRLLPEPPPRPPSS